MIDKETRMRKQRIDGLETRQRLLDAASMVFAEKGFWETTNADICQLAKINTASVNYHFGSKEELYIEAWKYSFYKSLKKHPPDGGIAPDAPADEKLRGRILSFMQRIADPKTYELEIVHKEMACPTGLLREVMHASMSTLLDEFKPVIAELVGTDADKKQVQYCFFNVLDLCFGLVHHIHRSKMLNDFQHSENIFSEHNIDKYADHVFRFCLAGIKNIRKENRRNTSSPKKSNKQLRNRSKS